jgi:hypothetical protein
MPKSGDILFYKDFEFEDGSKHNKLFIVICAGSSCLVLKTTSNNKRYQGVKEGCNPDKRVFFIPLENKEFFDDNTYIQFPQLFEFNESDLSKGTISRQIKIFESVLSNVYLQRIIDCLKHFKDDISTEHWEIIFSKKPETPSDDSLQKLALKFNKGKCRI